MAGRGFVRLSRTGPARRAKTVYARFRGAADDETYEDHIVLDEKRARVRRAVLERITGGGGRSAGRWRLRVRARDRVSGLAQLRTSRRRRGRQATRRGR